MSDPAEILAKWRKWLAEFGVGRRSSDHDMIELVQLFLEQHEALHDLLRGARFLERPDQPQHLDTTLGISRAVRALGMPRDWRPQGRVDEGKE